MKIIKIPSSPDELREYELRDVNKLDADFFVYWYEEGSYEGRGFAIWKKDGKYSYIDMGHCSCNGPIEDLLSIDYSVEEIEKISCNTDYNHGKEVMDYIKENNL